MYLTIAYSVMFVHVVCFNSYFMLLLSVECWCSRNCANCVFILVISGLFQVISGYCRTQLQ